ncbi:MAG TPA: sigma-54 dependent transcriptional regulator [Longimicrobiaceae bacterium]
MQAERAPLVLVVEDEDTLRESCVSVLTHEGYDVVSCARGDEARDLLQRGVFDIVLLDLHIPHVSGRDLLRLCLEIRPETLVIVMTGNASLESSMEVLKAGAWDYLAKPFTATHLQILLGRAWHTVQAARQARAAREAEGLSAPDTTGQSDGIALLGKSPAFQRVIKLAERVAATDASVFITGESGSGKEVIAQFIHQRSRRARKQMVAVNCAALPETLLESEMFGHVKGAFTGAVRDKPGLLETANGGTFFLDELTEMSPTIQAKLLRVIQDGQVRRVGAEMVEATVDVRFIAATNRNPKQAVEEGVLRKDLFFRLSVVPIRVPPLRERREDIPLLAEHFLALYWKRHRDKRSPVPTLSKEAIRSLQDRPWSGNVRELQNVMEHAVVLLEPGAEVQPDDLPYLDDDFDALSSGYSGEALKISVPIEAEYHQAREQVITEFELSYFNRLVDRANANMSEAARLAGVDRTTLYRLMEKHGLQRNTVIKAS